MPWWCSGVLACGPRPDTIVRTYDVPGERVMQSMANPFFTVGHSTRGVDEFIHLLRQAEVELVVDVRSIPRSGTNPQFNRETFRETLSAHSDWLRIHRDVGWSARQIARGTADGERILGAPKLSQLCGLRDDRGLSIRVRTVARVGTGKALYSHVRGSCMVAVSSAYHCGLLDRSWRGRAAHPWSEPHRACADDQRGATATGLQADLPGNFRKLKALHLLMIGRSSYL